MEAMHSAIMEKMEECGQNSVLICGELNLMTMTTTFN